ncbi:hypothetical protein EJB05_42215, partial [Eragrostis curvula]
MASASRVLLLARLRSLPPAAAASYRTARPLAAAGSLPPPLPWLSPPVTPPGAVTARRFAARRPATSSPQDNSRHSKNNRPRKGTAAVDGTDSAAQRYCRRRRHRLGRDPDETVTSDSAGCDEDDDDDDDVVEETVLRDGCDFKHWLVVMDPPPGDPYNPDSPRDEIIDSYIKTLAQVVGSENKARQKIYSVSTRCYFAFGALVSEKLSEKLKELPKVRWVLPDSYLDKENKEYGGEPFINGKAVPYDPKYHEWLKNSTRRGYGRPRHHNFDKSTGSEESEIHRPPVKNKAEQAMPHYDNPPTLHAHAHMPPPPDSGAGAHQRQPEAPPPEQGDASGQQGNIGGKMRGEPSAGFQGGNQAIQGNKPAGDHMHGAPGPASHSNNIGCHARCCPCHCCVSSTSFQSGSQQSNNNTTHHGGWPCYHYGKPPPFQGWRQQPPLQDGKATQDANAPSYQGHAVHHYYWHLLCRLRCPRQEEVDRRQCGACARSRATRKALDACNKFVHMRAGNEKSLDALRLGVNVGWFHTWGRPEIDNQTDVVSTRNRALTIGFSLFPWRPRHARFSSPGSCGQSPPPLHPPAACSAPSPPREALSRRWRRVSPQTLRSAPAAVIIRGFATQIEKPLDTSDWPPKMSSPHYSAQIEDTTSSGIRDSEHKQIVTSDGSCHENITTDDDGGYSEVTSDDEDFSYEEMPRGVRETRVMPGCDFNHWLVVMDTPPGDPGNPDVPREEIIDGYVKTLAQVVGSEEEARQKIYSVSTRHYFAFGALVSEELSLKLKELPKVHWVLADSYLDAENKDYGGFSPMASASRALRLARLHAPLRCGSGSSRPLRSLAAAAGSLLPAAPRPSPAPARFLSSQPAQSSLRDSSPNWSNRPPKETILLDGCDFEHWLVVMDPPPGNPGAPDIPREEIIDGYIKTLAQVVGSEEEARQKIYSVSTRHYFAFGALVSEELSYKLKELPNVRWVLPDSYLDVKNKDYGGEPFINGEAVPYDPKYHEEWVRNNSRVNQPRGRDRPHKPRNIERRENMQNFQNRGATPGQGFSNTSPPGQQGMLPRDAPPMHHAQPNMPPPPPSAGAPPYQAGYAPGSGQNYQQGGAPSYQGVPPGYQGSNQGYQGSPGGNMHGGSGPTYQGNPGFQRPGADYQSGSPPPPPFQGGSQPPFQSGNPPPYQGGNPSYGTGPNYQGPPGNQSYHKAGVPPYEGTGPGRNYQYPSAALNAEAEHCLAEAEQLQHHWPMLALFLDNCWSRFTFCGARVVMSRDSESD